MSVPRVPNEPLTFLRGLKRNNRCDWFNAHSDRYDAHVRAPMIAIIERPADDFRDFAPELVPPILSSGLHRGLRSGANAWNEVLDEHRFSHHGPRAARPGESGDRLNR
jgi:hypothetical protein